MAEFNTDASTGHEIWRAAKEGEDEALKLLVTASDADAVNWRHLGDGTSPLIIASACGRGGAVRILTAHAAVDVNQLDSAGRTALMVTGTAETTRCLVSTPGLDLNIQSAEGETALDAAIRFGKTETRDILLAVGAQRSSDLAGSRVYAAAREGQVELLSQLLAQHALEPLALNWANPSELRNTPLANACRWGDCPEVLALLLQSPSAHAPSIQPNAHNDHGVTALMYLAFRGDASSVQLLLARFPDLDLNATGTASWAQGRTALAIASKFKRDEVVALLQAAGGK